jgi:hypothetical protein
MSAGPGRRKAIELELTQEEIHSYTEYMNRQKPANLTELNITGSKRLELELTEEEIIAYEQFINGQLLQQQQRLVAPHPNTLNEQIPGQLLPPYQPSLLSLYQQRQQQGGYVDPLLMQQLLATAMYNPNNQLAQHGTTNLGLQHLTAGNFSTQYTPTPANHSQITIRSPLPMCKSPGVVVQAPLLETKKTTRDVGEALNETDSERSEDTAARRQRKKKRKKRYKEELKAMEGGNLEQEQQ